MGEIATWSAVKNKVGLGKDSNECPTKAELLALSPTGTGEDYVGLEISNASSYGNNETVQLSDIHRVTYKYTFRPEYDTIYFTALGGRPSSTNKFFTIISLKQKYLDGAPSGDPTKANYHQSKDPDWVYRDEDGWWNALENTETSERRGQLYFRQEETKIDFSVEFIQEAAVETWEYILSVKNSTLNVEAIGGKFNPSAVIQHSVKQRYINGVLSGDPIQVNTTWGIWPPSWIYPIEDGTAWAAEENKSENSRNYLLTITQAESGKKVTATFIQKAGVKTYSTPTVSLGSIADIPASGGTAATPTHTYSQSWGWNGKTHDGGTINSGASVVWSENISGSNLGATAKARTKLGSRTLTVTLNGKSGSASIDVYQAENRVNYTEEGEWEVSISANPSTFTEKGGTSQIYSSAKKEAIYHWTSGATSPAPDIIRTPTLSIPTPVAGFSLSGTTLTVAENTTSDERSVNVRATMGTIYKEVTVTQSAYLVEWKYYFTTSTPTLNFDALGTTQMPNLNSYREKYINGSLVEGSTEGVSAVKDSTTGPIKDVTPSGIAMTENITTQARTGTVVYKQTGSDKTVTITCNQAAGTVTTKEVLEWVNSGLGNVPAIGGSVSGTIQSGYWDVVNGKNNTFHPVVPTVVSKPDYVNITFTEWSDAPSKGNKYDMKLTFMENTEDARTAYIHLSYGSKTLKFQVMQLGSSITYNYTLDVFSPSSKVLNVPAKPSNLDTIIVNSYRTKLINDKPTSVQEFVDVTIDTIKDGWVNVVKGDSDLTQIELRVLCLENQTSSIRSTNITIQQVGTNKSEQVTINQAAAVVTTRDHINYVEPLPNGDCDWAVQVLEVQVESYQETLINGVVTNKVAVTPTVDLNLEGSETGWATVNVVKPDTSEYRYIIQIELSANMGSTRRGSIMPRNGSAEPESAFVFTQEAGYESVEYDLRWAISDRGNSFQDHVTSYYLDTGGEADRIQMYLLCDKIIKVNGIETSRVPIATGGNNLTSFGPVFTDQNGEPSSLIDDDGGSNVINSNQFPELENVPRSTYTVVIGSSQNFGIHQEVITMTFPNKVMDGSVEVGGVPPFIWTVDPVPYEQRSIFKFKNTDDTILNVTVEGNPSTSYSFDIESYKTFFRNSQEISSNYRQYKEPSVLTPLPSWATVHKNGQNVDNSYNYAISCTENNDPDRNTDIQFSNGESSTTLHIYLLQRQIPFDHIYIITHTSKGGIPSLKIINGESTDLTSYLDPDMSVDRLKSWKIPRSMVPADADKYRNINMLCQIPTDTNPQGSTFTWALQILNSFNGLDTVLTDSAISQLNNFWSGYINSIDSNPTYFVESNSVTWELDIERNPDTVITVNGENGVLGLAQFALVEKNAELDGTRFRIVVILAIAKPDSLVS